MKANKPQLKIPFEGKANLLDIHAEYEKMHSLTTILLEPIVMSRQGKKYNPVLDSIRAVCIVVHNERARLELGDIYKPVRILIVSKDNHEEIVQGNQKPRQKHIGILVGMKEHVEYKLVLNEVDFDTKIN